MLPQPARSTSRDNLMTIAQLIVSGLGMVSSLLSALGLVLLALMGFYGRSADLANITSLLSVAWISLLCAILAVPSLAISIQSITGRTLALPKVNSFRLASILLFVWPLVLWLGNTISGQNRLAWLLLPPLQLMAIGLPVWWLFEFARLKLPVGSRQRGWGLVSFSIFLTTPILIITEVVVIIILVVMFAVWATGQPQLLQELQRLGQQLSTGRQSDPEAILQALTPYLQNPLFIFGILGVMAWLIPLIEELLKPLAVWALAGRPLTPAEGFTAGALCGAAFALIESLFYLSNPAGETWAGLAIGRAGTGLLHITTAAMTGWALARAWRSGTYLQLGLTYLLAATLHGLWNGFSILTGLGAAMGQAPASLAWLQGLSKAAPFGIAAVGLILFFLLFGGNYTLRRAEQPVDPPESPENDGPFQPS